MGPRALATTTAKALTPPSGPEQAPIDLVDHVEELHDVLTPIIGVIQLVLHLKEVVVAVRSLGEYIHVPLISGFGKRPSPSSTWRKSFDGLPTFVKYSTSKDEPSKAVLRTSSATLPHVGE